jgi:hypothetical protein
MTTKQMFRLSNYVLFSALIAEGWLMAEYIKALF